MFKKCRLILFLTFLAMMAMVVYPGEEFLDQHPRLLSAIWGVWISLLGIFYLVYRNEIARWNLSIRDRSVAAFPWYIVFYGASWRLMNGSRAAVVFGIVCILCGAMIGFALAFHL